MVGPVYSIESIQPVADNVSNNDKLETQLYDCFFNIIFPEVFRHLFEAPSAGITAAAVFDATSLVHTWSFCPSTF